jgi:hypothetical protein
MIWLVLRTCLILFRIELVMRFRGLARLHELVRAQKLCRPNKITQPVEKLCFVVDLACSFYLKQVLCLQRSAVTALILRRHGWNAQMVIGVQLLPFNSHAWVEIEGVVVNDKPYVTDIYRVLERC